MARPSMRLREVLEMAATIAVAIVWFVALRPVALGGPASYIVVRGYSMSGTLAPGDLAVTMAQGSYSAGDAIVYHVPLGAGRGLLVVHRIIHVDPAGYTMQGDANSYQDPWQPKTSDVVGRLVLTLPGFGRALASLDSPFVLGAIWGLVVLVIGLTFLPDSRAPNPMFVTTPKPLKRRLPGNPSALDAATALVVSGMVGLMVLGIVVVVYPTGYLVAAVLSVAGAVAALIVGLFLLPDSSIPSLHLLHSKRPNRRRRAHPALDATTLVAASLMVGLALLSAELVVSSAHAAGLTLHSDLITARVTHCPAPPPFGGPCS